jgi:hypothetical protein
VARRSYIDPRVFDRYLSGWTIGAAVDRQGSPEGPDDRRRARLEKAVLDLLDDHRSSPAMQHDVGKNGKTAATSTLRAPARRPDEDAVIEQLSLRS